MSSKKQKAPPKKLVYARRSPAGAPRNPQNVLDTAPHGTRDWKRVLHCVLVIHNQEHSKLIKTVSQKTMLDRRQRLLLLDLAFLDHRKLQFRWIISG